MHIGPILRAMNHNRTRVVLIVLEIAMTLAIVSNCINVILAERQKMTAKSGFDDENIFWFRARPFTPEYREASFLDTTVDADVRAISSIPGVRAAANTSFRLWEGGGSTTNIRPVGGSGEGLRTQVYYGTKDLIQTLDSNIVAGRGFREGDHGVGPAPDPANVTVISKTVADALFPGQEAVGKSM